MQYHFRLGLQAKSSLKWGIKAEARKQMIAANVPVIPGSDDVVGTVERRY